jgi:hypothetical protein
MGRHPGRSNRDKRERALAKLIRAGAADLVIAVQQGELTAAEAYDRYLERKGTQR